MRIRQISRTGADMLLRIVGVLFWLMLVGGSLSLFMQAVQWMDDGPAPINERQLAFNAGLALVGWSGSRACALWRARLKARTSDVGLSAPRAH